MLTLQERTRQALVAGYTNAQLAKAAGKSAGAVTHWTTGTTKKLAAESAVGLAALTGWNVKWWTDGTGPREQENSTKSAHRLSLDNVTLTSPVIDWGDIKMKPLPQAFKVAAPDDSMSPRLKRGQLVEFEVGLALRPGDGVLVRDAEGEPCIRRCRRIHGAWEAYAEDGDNHLPFPIGPGQLLAVLVGVHARWG